ncbi:hypothetical protein [Streptomyces sp. NPDC001508]|uniref:hypothetical protein n=1 Tax=Streptomyces sp. NPDC001508 TaxID=3154656 RepID=UPI003321C51D
MARVVGVHGVGKQLLGEESLLKDWRPALLDGLRRVGGPALARGDLAMGFYGDLFRPLGQTPAVGDPVYGAADVEDGFEHDLLFAWWQAAAAMDDRAVPPDGDTLARTPRSVQAALRALSRSRFFSGPALRALVFDVRQTRRYLLEPELRQAVRDRVSAAIGDDTRVVVAHSLGSAVAYETLCVLDGHGVRTLVALGSPLGLAWSSTASSPHWPRPVRGRVARAGP